MGKIKNVAVFSNVRPRDREVARDVRAALSGAGFVPDAEPYHLVLSVGGDGTFLESVRRYIDLNVPFAGVNTGSLGFLQELTPDDIDMLVDSLSRGAFRVQSYPLLQAEAVTPGGGTATIRAFNDVVIEREATRVLHLEVTVGGRCQLEVVGDGLIISTAAGSTAYAAAAGGPYIHPAVPVFQLVPISPHPSEAYRSLAKPLVFPGGERVVVVPRLDKRRRFRLVADGAPWLRDMERLSVGLSDQTLNLLRFKDTRFWDRIACKLMGGGGRWGSPRRGPEPEV